jgi:hypothetical protein
MPDVITAGATHYRDLPRLAQTTFVAFGHKARQGKDTSALAIHCAYPELTTVISFADALKAYCRIALKMTRKEGKLLQEVGAAMRQIDEDIFVKSVYYKADELVGVPYVLVPDLRYRNEAAFIHAMGGACIKVERFLADGTRFIADDRPATHHSETELDDYDGWNATIQVLDGELACLRQNAVQAFHDLFL